MSRQERRQLKRDTQKSLLKKRPYEPITKGTRIFVIAVSSVFVFLFLYIALRDNSIPNDELSTVYVTLKEKPKYEEYKIKSTTYRNYTLTTKEYKREFKIGGMNYKAINYNAFESNVFAGDRVELKIKKSEIDNLNDNTYWNNYNDTYGLIKNGYNYVDADLRLKLTNKDSKWAYFFVIIGFAMLPYGFIKRKPLISMDKAIFAIAAIGLVVMLFLKNI